MRSNLNKSNTKKKSKKRYSPKIEVKVRQEDVYLKGESATTYNYCIENIESL